MIQTVYPPTITQQVNLHFFILSLKAVLMKKGQYQYLQSRDRHNAKRYFKKTLVLMISKIRNIYVSNTKPITKGVGLHASFNLSTLNQQL